MPSHVIVSAAAVLCIAMVSQSMAQTKIKGSEVVINGESFFAAANITSELTRLAKADGYIGASESFRQIAVSGAVMTGILNQYKNCTPKPLYMITDGGGNDLMGSCGGTPTPDCAAIKSALATVQQYFSEMKTGGTKKIIWMRYPDPQGSNWATLTANQNVYNPEVEKICKASVEPKCLWIDMRTTWEGHYAQYTSDGIHPTTAGGTATAEAFWNFAKENDFFSLGTTRILAGMNSAVSPIQGRFVSNHSLIVSLSPDNPVPVTLRLQTVSGKSVLLATKPETVGSKAAEFPLGPIAAGVYLAEIHAGRAHISSAVFVP